MQETKYLLIGGGVTSVTASQSIRNIDAENRIMIIGKENNYPTDRPPLTKQFLLKDEWTAEDPESKNRDFYTNYKIDLLTNTTALSIDRVKQAVSLDNGEVIRYEKLLLATGATPKKPQLPGIDLENVFTLRVVDDSDAIRSCIHKGGSAVIIGAGYLGVEVAIACAARGIHTTVIEPKNIPWSKFSSQETGECVRKFMEAKGVNFIFGDEAAAFEGFGRVSWVVTKKGVKLPASFVVIGIGVTLNTELASECGLQADIENGVAVNSYLKTSDPNIWAAGDIAFFDDKTIDIKWHVEHHLNAKWQGQIVGANMACEETEYDKVAYFFSDVLDLHMNLRGNSQLGRNSRILGNVESEDYIELYSNDDGRLTSTVMLSHDDPKLDKLTDICEELIRNKTNANDITQANFKID